MAGTGDDFAANWQKMLGEMEKNFNSFANQAMSTPEFGKFLNQAGTTATGAQKHFSELTEKYLLTMNLPSRAQIIALGEQLQSIQGQLNEIRSLLIDGNTGSKGSSALPRPARTKQPPSGEPA